MDSQLPSTTVSNHVVHETVTPCPMVQFQETADTLLDAFYDTMTLLEKAKAWADESRRKMVEATAAQHRAELNAESEKARADAKHSELLLAYTKFYQLKRAYSRQRNLLSLKSSEVELVVFEMEGLVKEKEALVKEVVVENEALNEEVEALLKSFKEKEDSMKVVVAENEALKEDVEGLLKSFVRARATEANIVRLTEKAAEAFVRGSEVLANKLKVARDEVAMKESLMKKVEDENEELVERVEVLSKLLEEALVRESDMIEEQYDKMTDYEGIETWESCNGDGSDSCTSD